MIKKRTLVTVVLVCAFILVGIILLHHYWSIHGSDLVNDHRVGNARGSRLLSFVDTQQGWMVGFGSDIFHTKNGGYTWQKQPTPAKGTLNAVYFIDSQHGWSVGDRGTVLQTSDGGKQWRLSASVTRADLLDVFFYDASHGWAVGDLSTFVKTNDGGVSWQASQIDPLSGPLTGVSFAPSLDPEFNGGPNFGLVVGAGGGIFRTMDGGKTWPIRNFQTANSLYGVVAVNALAWSGVDWFNFAAGSGGTFVFGHHHNFDEAILDGQPDIMALDFADDKLGWVVGEAGCIRKTNDGGKSWQLQDVRPFNLEAVKCIDSNHAWALSEPMPTGRILFMTTDAGASWNEKLVPSGGASIGINPDITETVPDSPFCVFVPKGHPISNEFILPDRRLLIEETSEQMSISACRGEYEPATFAIRSSVPLKNVFVKVSDLRGNAIIPANAVDVKWIKCWYQNSSHPGVREGLPVLVPELLLNNDALVSVGSISTLPSMDTEELTDSATLQPLDMASGFTKQVLLTVHVPDGAEAGEYVGEITVTADGQSTRKLKLRVTVLPFTLEPPMLDYAIYPASEFREGELYGRLHTRTPEQLRSLLVNMRAHGITHPMPVAQPITLVPPAGLVWGSPPVVPWRQVKYDPTYLRQYLEILDELGFRKDKLFWGNSYMMRHINYSKYQRVSDPNVKKWPPEAFMPTVNIVTGLAKEFGYGEVYFEGLNEVSGEHLEHGRPLFEMIRRAKTPVPAKVYNSAGKLYDVYDGVRCSLVPAADDIKKYQATGRFVYIYANPHSGKEQPYTYRRNVGLLLYKFGVNGASSSHDFLDSASDMSLVYYTKNGQIDTLPWEGWREGCDDVRYLSILHKTLDAAKGKNPQSVSQARSWLAGLEITDDAQQVRQQAIAHIMAITGQ